MGVHDREIRKVESGGLFLDMGKIIMILYKIDNAHADLDEEFILKYNPYLGLKIVERFKLPEFLKEIIFSPHFRFVEDSLHLSAIVNLAYSIVDRSFKKHGKLVLQSPMPDLEGLVPSTPGSIILDQFNAIGLGKYMEVIPVDNNDKKYN